MTQLTNRETRVSEMLDHLLDEDPAARTGSEREEPEIPERVMPKTTPSRTDDSRPDGGSGTTTAETDAMCQVEWPVYRIQRKPTFRLLQSWEGYVESVEKDSLHVILSDLTKPGNPREETDIPMEDVSPDDRDLVAPGAMFYWSIGYRQSVFGKVERVSSIRFRRVVPLGDRDLDRAQAHARQLKDSIGPDRA